MSTEIINTSQVTALIAGSGRSPCFFSLQGSGHTRDTTVLLYFSCSLHEAAMSLHHEEPRQGGVSNGDFAKDEGKWSPLPRPRPERSRRTIGTVSWRNRMIPA